MLRLKVMTYNLLYGFHERADKTLIRTGADSCTVEAVFHVGDAKALNAELEEFGVEPCEAGQLILKRVFSSAGTPMIGILATSLSRPGSPA